MQIISPLVNYLKVAMAFIMLAVNLVTESVAATSGALLLEILVDW